MIENIGSKFIYNSNKFPEEDEFNVPCSHYNGILRVFKNEMRICAYHGKEKAGYGLQALTKTMASGVNVCDFKLLKAYTQRC